jgi:hypothetical protein
MHRILVVVLLIGAVGGFASATHHHWNGRHEAFERHVADVCTGAALRALGKPGPGTDALGTQ